MSELRAAKVTSQTIDFADAFPTSHSEHGATQHVFLHLETGDNTGHGEGSALQWFTGETTETMKHVVRDLLVPRLLGLSIEEAFAEFYDFSSRLPNHPSAKACVEMALLDIKARHQEVALWELLGQRHRSEIPIDFVIGAISPTDAVEKITAAYDEGYRVFKVKADGDLEGDQRRINAVIDNLVDRAGTAEVDVRIDPNTGWGTAESTRRVWEDIHKKRVVEYLEQPVPRRAIDDLREIRTGIGVPVAADESVHNATDLNRLLQSPRAISAFCVKLAKVGGFQDILTLGKIGATRGIPVTLVSAFETSLGFAANLHLGAILPEISAAAELGSNLIATDPVESTLEREPAKCVPQGPGIGVRLDPELFERAEVLKS